MIGLTQLSKWSMEWIDSVGELQLQWKQVDGKGIESEKEEAVGAGIIKNFLLSKSYDYEKVKYDKTRTLEEKQTIILNDAKINKYCGKMEWTKA